MNLYVIVQYGFVLAIDSVSLFDDQLNAGLRGGLRGDLRGGECIHPTDLNHFHGGLKNKLKTIYDEFQIKFEVCLPFFLCTTYIHSSINFFTFHSIFIF